MSNYVKISLQIRRKCLFILNNFDYRPVNILSIVFISHKSSRSQRAAEFEVLRIEWHNSILDITHESREIKKECKVVSRVESTIHHPIRYIQPH